MRFSLKDNLMQVHLALPFLALRSLLFRNSSDPDVTPKITYLSLLLEI